MDFSFLSDRRFIEVAMIGSYLVLLPHGLPHSVAHNYENYKKHWNNTQVYFLVNLLKLMNCMKDGDNTKTHYADRGGNSA